MPIDKNVIALGWVSFFTDMASSMVTTLLPIFVVYVLDEGVDKLGYIIAIATFISYALRIVFGYLSDKYQIVKPFVVSGYFISALTKPLLAFSTTFTSVALLRAFERTGKAVRSAAKDSLISSYAKKSESGKTFGFHKTMDIAGELSGALIIVALFYFLNESETLIRDIFKLTLIPGIIATLIVLFFVKDMPKKVEGVQQVFQKADTKLFYLLGSYFLFLLFFMSDQYFILEAKAHGFLLTTIPLLVITSTLTQTLISYKSGLLIDKLGAKMMLFIAYCFAILSLVFLQAHLLWFAFALLGAFSVISVNAMRSYISQNAQSKAFLYGILYGGIALSSALSAIIISQIWQKFGFAFSLEYSLIGTSVIAILLLIHLFYTKVTDADKN